MPYAAISACFDDVPGMTYLVPVSRARSHPVPGVVAGSGTMQISNIMDVISIFIHITHECMDSKKLMMWSLAKKT